MKRKKRLKFTELTDSFITRKTNFVCCSQKSRASRQDDGTFENLSPWTSFCRVETSRSHLAWSTDDRNLTDFLVIKTNLPKVCPKCDLGQSDERQTNCLPLMISYA